jgi:hypothetical protein
MNQVPHIDTSYLAALVGENRVALLFAEAGIAATGWTWPISGDAARKIFV